MNNREALEATIRTHVHPAGFGFWCTEGEDLPAELAGVLAAEPDADRQQKLEALEMMTAICERDDAIRRAERLIAAYRARWSRCS